MAEPIIVAPWGTEEREYLFDERTGFYLACMPVGWQWGWAELDPALHTIIRTADARFADRDSLRCHRKKLVAHHGAPLPGTNIFLAGELGAVPPEEHIVRSAYILMRTGKKYEEEEEMWADVRDGDVLAYSHRPSSQEHADYVLKILSAKDRKLEYRPVTSMREVAQCLSQK